LRGLQPKLSATAVCRSNTSRSSRRPATRCSRARMSFSTPSCLSSWLGLEGRDQALGRQLGPGAAQAGGARHPDHHLQVAQAAGAFLAVGLQRIGRAFVLDVALAHLQRLGAQEGLGVHRRRWPAKGVEQPLARRTPGGFEQRGLHGHVALRLGHAFGRAHRRADLQPDVPAGGDEARWRRACRVGLVGGRRAAGSARRRRTYGNSSPRP
jgi:hypothetical protein